MWRAIVESGMNGCGEFCNERAGARLQSVFVIDVRSADICGRMSGKGHNHIVIGVHYSGAYLILGLREPPAQSSTGFQSSGLANGTKQLNRMTYSSPDGLEIVVNVYCLTEIY